ncbi:protein ANTAGONIST OF LIKE HETEROCHROMATIN PROTEIN 1 [Monomorium pharaonis]|uniref:protein ANTAGONIST OF LIKE HETEROCHROMATIN PROTEIN 1 n=1 Tax=Monomorium pharaonis TaxID=307658 RepID=UPI00102E1416|nr:protein ANTAGONIST OF LIKE HETEROCHROMATIN PROTEIN 1 [Monomorium pharaonis]
MLFFPNNEFIIGDKAYPVLPWCIAPYVNRGNMTEAQKNFNQHLSKMRQVIERSFAFLKGRFRRLKYLHMSCVELIPSVVLACCVLHNICLNNCEENYDIDDYIQDGLEDVNDDINDVDRQQFDDERGLIRREYLTTLLADIGQ